MTRATPIQAPPDLVPYHSASISLHQRRLCGGQLVEQPLPFVGFMLEGGEVAVEGHGDQCPHPHASPVAQLRVPVIRACPSQAAPRARARPLRTAGRRRRYGIRTATPTASRAGSTAAITAHSAAAPSRYGRCAGLASRRSTNQYPVPGGERGREADPDRDRGRVVAAPASVPNMITPRASAKNRCCQAVFQRSHDSMVSAIGRARGSGDR